MQTTVGTAAVRLAVSHDAGVLIQNLGSGNLYVDRDPNVSAASGVKVAADSEVSFLRNLSVGGGDEGADLYMIADAAGTDVRYVEL